MHVFRKLTKLRYKLGQKLLILTELQINPKPKHVQMTHCKGALKASSKSVSLYMCHLSKGSAGAVGRQSWTWHSATELLQYHFPSAHLDYPYNIHITKLNSSGIQPEGKVVQCNLHLTSIWLNFPLSPKKLDILLDIVCWEGSLSLSPRLNGDVAQQAGEKNVCFIWHSGGSWVLIKGFGQREQVQGRK